jgi:sigma-B regulation protein RsbU (phosphoserine phosphatase)
MPDTPRLEAKLLYRRLDSLFGTLDLRKPLKQVLTSFLSESFRLLKDDLRLKAAALYGERRDGFALIKQAGRPGGPPAEAWEAGRPPLSLVFQHRVYIFDDAASPVSPGVLGLLPPGPAAALVVGRRPFRHVLFFLMDEGWEREELDFTLNTVRAALGARLRDERVRGNVREAAEIQQSLLLEEPPPFPGFELAARSIPAEEVGGDFYDFLSLNGAHLGLAIGDASGHGLPAALLVRDVVTSLRMGVELDLKMSYVFDKLNRVIHRSALSSRFVSVFYGELESDGSLLYVNAGHQPPLLVSPRGLETLTAGGTVIGPLPEVRFARGFTRLRPGDVLVLCTDGILERRSRSGEFFGEERLRQVAVATFAHEARAALDAIVAASFAWGDGRPWEDDATVVVVRRLAGGAGAGPA